MAHVIPSATRVDVSSADLATEAARLLGDGYRLALVAAHDDTAVAESGSELRVVYLFTAGPPDRRTELHLRVDPADPRVPSLAALSFPASRFEREMRDLYGIEPDGHPMPRPLAHHPHWPADWHPMRAGAGQRPPLNALAPFPFVTVEGEGVYEIPVGPVHAGLIEPGHFRFSVVGETILKMKARLWYVHKGIERLFHGADPTQAVGLAERISGDTVAGHALAYSLAVEDALGIQVNERAQRARAILLELERLHNHVTDIGALCNDVAYGVAYAHALRIREQLLRLNQQVTGHRLLRGGIFPGGADLRTVPDVRQLRAIAAEASDLTGIALRHSVIRERFTGTARLARQQAADLGTLGYVAKASGLTHDARVAHPLVALDDPVAVAAETAGDVLARFQVRADEIQQSMGLLDRLLPTAAAGPLGTPGSVRAERSRGSGVGIVEGWRGTIVHRVEIGGEGRLSRVKVVDPSFLNWPALPVALADTIVPDFPLANKSFNLSYAGNDL